MLATGEREATKMAEMFRHARERVTRHGKPEIYSIESVKKILVDLDSPAVFLDSEKDLAGRWGL